MTDKIRSYVRDSDLASGDASGAVELAYLEHTQGLAVKHGDTWRVAPSFFTSGLHFLEVYKPDLWIDADQAYCGVAGARDLDASADSGEGEFWNMDSNVNTGTSDCFIAMWLKRDVTGSSNVYLFYSGSASASEKGLRLQFSSSDQLKLYYSNGSNQGTEFGPIIDDNEWHHILLNMDRDGNLTWYVDGQADSTDDISAHDGTSWDGDRTTFRIGGTSNYAHDGAFCRIAYGESLLTASDIAELYNDGVGATYAELSSDLRAKMVHYWNGTEASGALVDQAASNDGTAVNTPVHRDGPRQSRLSDSSGNHKHGTLTSMDNLDCWSSDVPSDSSGYSLEFDGSDDEVDCGSIGDVTSVEMSVKSLVDNQELMALQDSTATAVTVSGGTLTFGGSLSGSNITVDGDSKTAAEAGALLNDNGWHTLTFDLTSITASDLRLGTDSSAYGNIRISYVKFNDGDLADYDMNDAPQAGVPSDGDPIASLETREGGRYLFQQDTAANRPTYVASGINSQPVLDFDGSDDYLKVAQAILSGERGTVFAVVQPDAGSQDYYLSVANDGLTSNTWQGGITGSLEAKWRSVVGGTTNEINGDTSLSTGTPYIMVLSSDGEAISIRVNGSDESLTVATGSNNGDCWGDLSGADSTAIGLLLSSSQSNYWNGYVAEIIAYDSVVLPNDVQDAIETYLATKYGITL